MLPRLVTEFRELFDALVCARLHPHDVVALGAVCRDMYVLCVHPAALHVRAYMHVLASVRAMRYTIRPNLGYTFDRDNFVIVHPRESTVSIRNGAVYCHWPAHKVNHGRSRSSRLYVRNGAGMYSFIETYVYGTIVATARRQCDYEYAWITRTCTLTNVSTTVIRFLNDVRPLAYTCKQIHSAIRHLHEILHGQ